MNWVSIGDLQPSKLAVCETKLREVSRWLSGPDGLAASPLSVSHCAGATVLVDGHARALHLYRLGIAEAPVIWNVGTLDDDAFAIRVGWCREADVESVAGLSVWDDQRFAVEWDERCDQMQARLTKLRDSWATLTTSHYLFQFPRGSHAEKMISDIAVEQERCFARIMAFLGSSCHAGPRIRYVLCETRADVGFLAGEESPLSGFADSRSGKIVAVCSERESCLGIHEDAHVLAARHWGHPPQAFVRESLAMHLDETWHGEDVVALAAKQAAFGSLPSLSDLCDDERFWSLDCNLSYPVAGAFASFLIEVFGMKGYRSFYVDLNGDLESAVMRSFGVSMQSLERRFASWLLAAIQA